MTLAALRALCNQLVKPTEFTADQLCSLPAPQEDQLAESCFKSIAEDWDFALKTSDPSQLWHPWNSCAEEFFCKRAKNFSASQVFRSWSLSKNLFNNLIRRISSYTTWWCPDYCSGAHVTQTGSPIFFSLKYQALWVSAPGTLYSCAKGFCIAVNFCVFPQMKMNFP